MPYSHVPQLAVPEASTGADAGAVDIRLIVTDMDGTLLDDDKRVPEGLWDTLAALRERG
ncbi:HAD family hydrolase, partial [Streptomyces sp. NPDC002920]